MVKASDSSPSLEHQLRHDSYKRSVGRLQRQLKPFDRHLSRLLHYGPVESLSESLAHSLARPSAVLGAGLAVVIGSPVLLWQAKHQNNPYNLLYVLALAAGGFIFGLLVELARKLGR